MRMVSLVSKVSPVLARPEYRDLKVRLAFKVSPVSKVSPVLARPEYRAFKV